MLAGEREREVRERERCVREARFHTCERERIWRQRWTEVIVEVKVMLEDARCRRKEAM